MAMTIEIATTQTLGSTRSPQGEVPYWRVKFQLEGADAAAADISIAVKGPHTAREAQKAAFEMLRKFLSEAYAAAKNLEI
jgi:hypothetical protein